jgi:hypothetical protein
MSRGKKARFANRQRDMRKVRAIIRECGGEPGFIGVARRIRIETNAGDDWNMYFAAVYLTERPAT